MIGSSTVDMNPCPRALWPDKKIDRKEFKQAIRLYYQMMGWDDDGRPTRAKLAELSFGWVEETQ